MSDNVEERCEKLGIDKRELVTSNWPDPERVYFVNAPYEEQDELRRQAEAGPAEVAFDRRLLLCVMRKRREHILEQKSSAESLVDAYNKVEADLETKMRTEKTMYNNRMMNIVANGDDVFNLPSPEGTLLRTAIDRFKRINELYIGVQRNATYEKSTLNGVNSNLGILQERISRLFGSDTADVVFEIDRTLETTYTETDNAS